MADETNSQEQDAGGKNVVLPGEKVKGDFKSPADPNKIQMPPVPKPSPPPEKPADGSES